MPIEFEHLPINWGNPGIEPSEEYKAAGYAPGDKPPAGYFNWALRNQSETVRELQAILSILLPAGVTIPYAGPTAPEGWLFCQGQAVSREEYANLFAAIGVTFGTGNGSTTFNLPDARDRVAVGAGSSYTLGAKGGSATQALTGANLAKHDHSGTNFATYIYLLGFSPTAETNRPSLVPASSAAASKYGAIGTGAATGTAGSGTAVNNLQPYIGMNFIIKT